MIVAGVLILSTAHGLLTQAERVQAEQVTAPVSAVGSAPADALIPVGASAEAAHPDAPDVRSGWSADAELVRS